VDTKPGRSLRRRFVLDRDINGKEHVGMAKKQPISYDKEIALLKKDIKHLNRLIKACATATGQRLCKLDADFEAWKVITLWMFHLVQARCSALEDFMEVLVRAVLLTDDAELRQKMAKNLERKDKRKRAKTAMTETWKEHLQKALEDLESTNPAMAALLSSLRNKRDLPKEFF
jgi:hypothetical protein